MLLFDANGGVFEPLFGKDDAIISDSLIMRLSSTELDRVAVRYRYINNDMSDLENN